ncbi:MAG: capsid cement protein [Syntrophobacteraceae bacterium]
MAALTSDRKTVYREGIEIEYKVAAGAKIYAGSLVCLNTAGYAAPGADTASFRFIGVAVEHADNSSGENGDITVRVRRKGVFRFAASGMAITDIGAAVKVSDDQTVAKSTTNSVACGTIAEFISATMVGVDLDMR